MNELGLFNFLSDWKTNLYEKRIAEAESLGHCPDCRGKGFQMPLANEYYLADTYDCPGCNGNGTFASWNENQKTR